MDKITNKLQEHYKLVHELVHSNMKWKNITITPSIIQKKSLSKFSDEEKKALTSSGTRWKLYYYYLNSDTNEFDRHYVNFPFNRDYKDFDTRYKVINNMAKATKELLKGGYVPPKAKDDTILTIKEAFNKALLIKKDEVSAQTYLDYSFRTLHFVDYLRKTHKDNLPANQLNAKMVREFLNLKNKETSATNRNNYLRSLRSVIKCMYQNEMIDEFFIDKIEAIKAQPKTQKIYTEQQINNIHSYLENNDTTMLLFIYFVSYNFLRPKEVVRLKMSDININEKILTVRIKQKISKLKRIPDVIIDKIKDLDYSEKDAYLFTNNGLVGYWNNTDERRRSHFTKRYAKIKKVLGFDSSYGIYSFRHTYITRAFKTLTKRLGKYEAYDELMRYTGHETRDAMIKYIHNIDADIVDDYDGEVV